MKQRLIREVQGYEAVQLGNEWFISIHVGTVKLTFPTGQTAEQPTILLGKTRLVLEYETPDAQP